MELLTKVNIPESDFKIDYKSNLFFIGSCFADSISKRFAERKFHVMANPLGVVYNPLSIENQLCKIADDEPCWNRWDYQGNFSDDELRTTQAKAQAFIKKADIIFVTLGTAFVYFLKETGKAVANCHKEPAEHFERRLISVDEAAEALKNIVHSLSQMRPLDSRFRENDIVKSENDLAKCESDLAKCEKDKEQSAHDSLHIVFTVSPIRHLNDGAHGNNLSKATLHLAIEKVMNEFEGAAATLSYFPSFEIAMDELRDYRFYAEDMAHLSSVAEDYIFERMRDTYCESNTIANIHQVKKFMKTANHRITNMNSERTRELAMQQTKAATALEQQIPGLDLSQEKEMYSQLV